MGTFSSVVDRIFDSFPWIALVVIFYYFFKLSERYYHLRSNIELENVRNQHQKEMFDRNSNFEKEMIQIKQKNEIDIFDKNVEKEIKLYKLKKENVNN